MQLKRPSNKQLQKEAEQFMKKNDNDLAARDILKFEAEKRNIKSKGELQDWARKNGFMKTERDLDVVKDVQSKLKLKDNADYDKSRRGFEALKKAQLNSLIER